MTQDPVVVIGAGPAGIASAAELQRRGVAAVVLERSDAVAASWRGRYDRLRLNSSRWVSQLPGARYPRGTAAFPARDEVVRYFDDYAQRARLDIRFGTRVERIDRYGRRWLVRTAAGDIAASDVLVATGFEHTPHIPEWPGRERFRGPLVHAARYRNPEPFRGADVLVVGPGSSGMEIAYDLAVHGGARVRLAVRTPPNLLLRHPAGAVLGRLLVKLSPQRADAVLNVVRRLHFGDLSAYGLPVPEEGIVSRLRRLRVAPAIVDKATIQAIKDGRIEVVRGVVSLDETGVLLDDGSRVEPDAVIAATGYRPGLEGMVGHLGVLDEQGAPRAVLGAPAAPGLRFIGYRPLPGHIGRMGGEAMVAAAAIAEERAATASAAAPRRRPGWRPAAAGRSAGA